MPEYTVEDLDRAATGRHIGILVGLTLIRTHGDPDQALALLAQLNGVAPPEVDGELDAVPIAEQAIRDAVTLNAADV